MLEHEDHEMMRPFEIVKSKNTLKNKLLKMIYQSR
jgi:spore coat protein A, manganese oxidase